MVEKPAPNIRKGDLIDARAANLRANLQRRKQASAPKKPQKEDPK